MKTAFLTGCIIAHLLMLGCIIGHLTETNKLLKKQIALNTGCDTANIHGYDISDCEVDAE